MIDFAIFRRYGPIVLPDAMKAGGGSNGGGGSDGGGNGNGGS